MTPMLQRFAKWCLLPVSALALTLAFNCTVHPAPQAPIQSGAFVWQPELAPQGPVLVVASLAQQRLYVYRNGIRIGASRISTGKPGFETPTGTFTILEKEREHYSNLYANAPMPFMERLTWGGVALHAGKVLAHPASHGCIRLPLPFAEKLYAVTEVGTTVVIVDKASEPLILQPTDFLLGQAGTAAMPIGAAAWNPERSPSGPVSIVMSAQSQEVVILRNAIEIGRARIEMEDDQVEGTHAYLLLEEDTGEPSLVVPGRTALRWLDLDVENERSQARWDLRNAISTGRLRIPEDFARNVYDYLVPGTTLVITDEAIEGSPEPATKLLEADGR